MFLALFVSQNVKQNDNQFVNMNQSFSGSLNRTIFSQPTQDHQLQIAYNKQISQSMQQPLLNQQDLQPPRRAQEQSQTHQLEEHRASRRQLLKKPRNKKFPTRPFLTLLMILLTTVQVLLIIKSHVYLHSSLVRSFLNLYIDQDLYPELFQGNKYYIFVYNLTEFQNNVKYVLETVSQSDNETILNMNFKQAKIYLYVQYHYSEDIKNEPSQIIIDPNVGIIEPFNANNLTSIKQFLLKIKFFQIRIQNLNIQTSGLSQTYDHRIIYHLERGNQVTINFQFTISNALASTIDAQRPQTLLLLYLKLFYFTVFFVALANFYVNIQYIRKTFKDFYRTLRKKAHKQPGLINGSNSSINIESDIQQTQQIHQNIKISIQVRHITETNKKWQDYVAILQVQALYSAISSILMMIGNAYLFVGSQHQIIIGIGCLLSWITIFGISKKNKKLLLMYELIKMSIVRVLQFLFSFFILFLGYTLMGMCWFPKVLFFSSMSYSVTTLSSLMAGDSVSMIVTAMEQKYSSFLSIFYIFSYILLFMHAIHNTLTAIIKQYFLLQKIQSIKEEKILKKQQDVVYLHQVPRQTQSFLKAHRLKLTHQLSQELEKIKLLLPLKKYNRMVRMMLRKLEHMLSEEKWEIFDQNLHQHAVYQQSLRQRLQLVLRILRKWKQIQQSHRLNSAAH